MLSLAPLAALLILGFLAPGIASSGQGATKSPISVPITKQTQHFHRVDSTIVDFDKLNAHLTYVRNKYSRTFANFRANTGVAHPLQDQDLTLQEQLRQASGTVALKDFKDMLWTGRIAFGQPAQSVVVQFDTGSTDTVVTRGAYVPERSSTSVRTSKRFNAIYADGTSASGIVYKDTVTIGGLQAPSAAIGLSDSQFLDPENEGGNQGISGLAFQNASEFKLPGFFDSLSSAGVLSAPVFSFRLATTGSTLTLGGYDKAHISGAITWLPVDPAYGVWVVPGRVNGFGPLPYTIMDTGTSAIVAPVADALTLFKNLGMQVRNYTGELTGIQRDDGMILGTFFDGACISSIIGINLGLRRTWIFGDPFLRSVISIFDKGHLRFGLATPAR
ncbi:hypothetical protein A4X06_0g9500 [Tilletia controversa]|uniref:Peptidase A1 domain-containing protein n=1 Tax=Tilletia controversa TaxID=13291 RepID=A0A8X7SRT6_9BASI|nr:hypothetical protein A4X06_0g9500 [Tilletia controversa]